LRYCARESSRPECSQWWRGNVAAASLREVAKPCGARCGQEERQEIQGLAFGFGHRDCTAQWPFDRRKIRPFRRKQTYLQRRFLDAARISAGASADHRSNTFRCIGIARQRFGWEKRETHASQGYRL